MRKPNLVLSLTNSEFVSLVALLTLASRVIYDQVLK